MSFWKTAILLCGGLWLIGYLGESKESSEEYKSRERMTCYFSNGLTRDQFELIVNSAGKHIKRLTGLYVSDANVYGTVRSKSGITEWNFKLDFNDYGNLTGKYWLYSDNEDSNIPHIIGNRIKAMIETYNEEYERNSIAESNTNSLYDDSDNVEISEEEITPEQEYENLQFSKYQAEQFEVSRKEQKKKEKHKTIRLIFILLASLIILFIVSVDFKADAESVFVKKKFLKGALFGLRLSDSEKLNTNRLAASYNERIIKIVDNMAQEMNNNCFERFKIWKERLLGVIDANLTELNPELKSIAEIIRIESDSIAELENNQKTIQSSLDDIIDLMAWKEV